MTDIVPKKQYPDDWLPPLRGRCQWPIVPSKKDEPKCNYETRGYTKAWLGLCPYHWRKL